MNNQEFNVKGRLSDDSQSLIIENAYRVSRMFRHLKDTDLEIVFKKFFNKRSNRQNKWLWGICISMTLIPWYLENEGITYTKEALYAFLRTRVVGQDVVVETIDGVDVMVISGKRFSQMTTVEFSNAVEKIVLYYAERGLEIPLPKDDNLLTDFLTDD